MLDVNLSWKDHIKTVENKLAESFGLLYCTKQFLDETALKTIHFSFLFELGKYCMGKYSLH